MPRKPKQQLKNLHKIDVLVNDRNSVSKYFKIKKYINKQPLVQDVLTDVFELPLGRSVVLIEGSSLLRPKSDVQVEIVRHGQGIQPDSDVNPMGYISYDETDDIKIITEPMFDFLDGNSRGFSITVHEEDLRGVIDQIHPDSGVDMGIDLHNQPLTTNELYCTLTVVGELDPTKTFIDGDGNPFRIPKEWQGVYNVKWSCHCKINPDLINDEPIIFKKDPKLLVTEHISPYYEKTWVSSSDSLFYESRGNLTFTEGNVIDPETFNEINIGNFRGNFTLNPTVANIDDEWVLLSGSMSQSIVNSVTQSADPQHFRQHLTVPLITNSPSHSIMNPFYDQFSGSIGNTAYTDPYDFIRLEELPNCQFGGTISNSNVGSVFLRTTYDADGNMESGSEFVERVGPGDIIAVENPALYGAGNFEFIEIAGPRNSIIPMYHLKDTYTSNVLIQIGGDINNQQGGHASSRGCFYNRLPMAMEAKHWQGTGIDGDVLAGIGMKLYKLHMNPFSFVRDGKMEFDSSDPAASGNVISVTGSTFLKHTAYGTDSYTHGGYRGGWSNPNLARQNILVSSVPRAGQTKYTGTDYNVKGGEVVKFTIWCHSDGYGAHIGKEIGLRKVQTRVFFNGEDGIYGGNGSSGYGISAKTWYVGEEWTKLEHEVRIPFDHNGQPHSDETNPVINIAVRVDNDGMENIDEGIYPMSHSIFDEEEFTTETGSDYARLPGVAWLATGSNINVTDIDSGYTTQVSYGFQPMYYSVDPDGPDVLGAPFNSGSRCYISKEGVMSGTGSLVIDRPKLGATGTGAQLTESDIRYQECGFIFTGSLLDVEKKYYRISFWAKASHDGMYLNANKLILGSGSFTDTMTGASNFDLRGNAEADMNTAFHDRSIETNHHDSYKGFLLPSVQLKDEWTLHQIDVNFLSSDYGSKNFNLQRLLKLGFYNHHGSVNAYEYDLWNTFMEHDVHAWVKLDKVKIEEYRPSKVYWDKPSLTVNFKNQINYITDEANGQVRPDIGNNTNGLWNNNYDQRANIPGDGPSTNLQYTIQWYKEPNYQEQLNFISYAKVDVIDMETWSGDIEKINLKYRRGGTNNVSNWDMQIEETLESKEVFYDISSSLLSVNIGDFHSQEHIDQYWYSPDSASMKYDNNWGQVPQPGTGFKPVVSSVALGHSGSTTDDIYFNGSSYHSSEFMVTPGTTYTLNLQVQADISAADRIQNEAANESYYTDDNDNNCGRPQIFVFIAGDPFDTLQGIGGDNSYENNELYPPIFDDSSGLLLPSSSQVSAWWQGENGYSLDEYSEANPIILSGFIDSIISEGQAAIFSNGQWLGSLNNLYNTQIVPHYFNTNDMYEKVRLLEGSWTNDPEGNESALTQYNGLGFPIANLKTPLSWDGDQEWSTYKYNSNFSPISFTIPQDAATWGGSNSCKLVFKIVGNGTWKLNNVSVSQHKETAFSPPNYTFYASMPRELQDEVLDFETEFYPKNSAVKSEVVARNFDVNFEGGNIVLLGGNNVLSGSLIVGSGIDAGGGGGFEMSGMGSAFLRTLGYKTYNSASRGESPAGFMMWSGSIFGSTTDEYSGSNKGGVGFEFHGGSGSAGESTPGARDGRTNALRFRTDTGKLEVTGTIAADDGKIGGWEIVSDMLSGSNITMDANSSAIYKTDDSQNYFIDFTPGTASGVPDSNREGHYVKFGPNFSVKNDGTLVASGAKIEGVLTSSEGFIGGWKILTDKLHSYNLASSTNGNMMLSGSGVISSSHFYVSETGDMSASNAWFTGTVTASVVESEEGNISNWVLEPGLLRDSADTIRLQSSGSSYQISSSKFQVSTQGQMTASAGKVGGWIISDGNLTSDNIKIESTNQRITVKSDTFGHSGIQLRYSGGKGQFHVGDGSNSGLRFDGDNLQITSSNVTISGSDVNILSPKFFLGDTTTQFVSGADSRLEVSSSGFHLLPTGVFTASDGYIAGWTVDSTKISKAGILELNPTADYIISASNFQVDAEGRMTASAGKIANWDIDTYYLTGSNITLDGESSAIFKSNDPDNYFIDFTPGVGTDEGLSTSRATNYVKFGPNFRVDNTGTLHAFGAEFQGSVTASGGQIGGFTIGSHSLHSDNIFLSGSPTFGGVDDNEYMFISTSKFNVKSNGDVSGSNVLFTGGQIGGWHMDSTKLSGSNLLLHSEGRLETADFASGVKGWRISAANNGEAEFENATIRGTLSTTTFEKESVNAVGGQLYVANSTIITGSAIEETDATMSVANVTGFSVGEILSVKKITDTGFSTEYLYIESASRDTSVKANELQGKIFVKRGYSGSAADGQESGSLGDTPGLPQTYTQGQVIVSTGKVDSGYIRLNANPNDTTTPYMDIVERTGSNIYDVQLKVRLGDLSGLSQTQLLGTNPANAGFGLFSENVYLTGGIKATYGDIGGWGIGSGVISSSNNTVSLNGAGPYYISSSGFQVDGDGAVTASLGLIAGWSFNGTSLSKGTVSLNSNEKSYLVQNASQTKNIIRVGDQVMSETTGSIQALYNGGFELSTDAGPGIVPAYWNIRLITGSNDFTINSVNKDLFMETIDGNTGTYAGTRAFRIKLETGF